MEVIVFLKSFTENALVACPPEIIQDLKRQLIPLGTVKKVETLGKKYLTAIVRLPHENFQKLEAQSKVMKIAAEKYAGKLFKDYQQFKSFVLNMEKRFFLIEDYSTSATESAEMRNRVSLYLGPLIFSSVDGLVESDTYRNPARSSPSRNQVFSSSSDSFLGSDIENLRKLPSFKNKSGITYLVEADKTKVSISRTKLQEVSTNFKGILVLLRYKIFCDVLRLFQRSPRNSDSIESRLSFHSLKPTCKLYHLSTETRTPNNQQTRNEPEYHFRVHLNSSIYNR